MKRFFKFLLLLLPVLLLSCEGDDSKEVTLTPDKLSITADGQDKVTFTVKYGDEIVTSGVKLTVNGEAVAGMSFTTTTEGEYKFIAEYKGKTSKEAIINANKPIELTLVADKTTIVADGEDKVTFTVTSNGEDITDESRICHKDGACLVEPVYTANDVGEYIFYATLKDGDGTNKSNEVTITTVESKFNATKTLHKSVAFFTYTATWCGPCYNFKTYMKKLQEDLGGDHIVQVNYYTADSNNKVSSSLSGVIRNQLVAAGYDFSGVPTLIVELSQQLQNAERVILNAYSKYVEKPAKVGIKVSSTVTDTAIDLTVTVGAQEAGTYYIGSFLTEDNISAPQTGSTGSYNHTNVLRAKGESNIFGSELGTMAVGETMTKDYSFTMNASYIPENLNVVVYVLYENDGKKVIANSVKAPANGVTNFRYED